MASLTALIAANPLAAVIIALVLGILTAGNADKLPDWIKNFIPGMKAKADGAKADASAAIDDISAKIQALLDKFGIPQSIENVKRFAGCTIALVGVDGLKKIVDDVVPVDRLSVVDAALETIHSEVASALVNRTPTPTT